MSINSILKSEGIEVLKELDARKIDTISKNIASRISLAFPEHGLSRNALFSKFCKLDMFIAKLPKDSSGAKYLFKNNSIYFNENLTLDEMADVAVHECIHFIQRTNNKSRLGLYDYSLGLALNEAAVQLMASEANMYKPSFEKYYNISIENVISPNYYPLECTLVNEMAYFTGTYPLYNSTLYGNDVFKNTFIKKSSEQAYKKIARNLDVLLSLENEVNYFVSELQFAEKLKTIRLLNKLIDLRKQKITLLFFKTQNLIIKDCFCSEYDNIRNIESLKEFKKRLYEFKNIIGSSDSYSFYNNFYCDMMNAVSKKESLFIKYEEINLFEDISPSLALLDTAKTSFDFIKLLTSKIKKLSDFNRSKNDINEY